MSKKRIVCPKCGGRLCRDALVQYAFRSRINFNGTVSITARHVKIGPEDAEIIFCESCGASFEDAYTVVVDGKEILVWNDGEGENE